MRDLGWIIILVIIKGLSAKFNIECQFSLCWERSLNVLVIGVNFAYLKRFLFRINFLSCESSFLSIGKCLTSRAPQFYEIEWPDSGEGMKGLEYVW